MKKPLIFLIFIFIYSNNLAQVPEKMSYQAVIRDQDNQLATNHAIGMQVSILQKTPDGVAVFVERHFPTTNANGLVSIEIGAGTPISGSLESVDWADGPYFIKTETDLNGGANYTITGTSQLLSVPYAMHAKTVEEDLVNDADADPVNEIQSLSLNGNTLSLSKNGGTLTLPTSGESIPDNWGSQVVESDNTLIGDGTEGNPLGVDKSQLLPDWQNIQGMPAGFSDDVDDVEDSDADPENEIQYLNLSGYTLTLSRGGTVTLPTSGESTPDDWGTQVVQSDNTLTGNGTAGNPLGVDQNQLLPDWTNIQGMPIGFSDDIDDVEDGDSDPMNEIQTLTKNGNAISLSNGGSVTDSVDDADADPANELQSLSINGNQITLSEGGGTVSIPEGGSIWQESEGDVYYNGGNVGIGIENPEYLLEVNGDAKINGITVGVGAGSTSSNTAIGLEVLSDNTTGYWNTAIGYQTMKGNTTGNRNTAIGSQALRGNSSGNFNVAVGHRTLYANKGVYNTALGYTALNYNTDGYSNTALGAFSLHRNTLGKYNTAVGDSALNSNTEGNYNTATGSFALMSNTIGYGNTAYGYKALFSNTEGYNNTVIGHKAFYNNIEAYGNVVIGDSAAFHIISGYSNTVIGSRTLSRRLSSTSSLGSNNVVIGHQSDISGTHNTAVGARSSIICDDGDMTMGNTVLGYQSSIQSGSNNCTVLGSGSYLVTNRTNVTMIGCGVTDDGFYFPPMVTGNNQVILGNKSVTQIRANVGSITTFSDARLKINIKENVAGLDFIMKLKPVTFNKKPSELYQIWGEKDTSNSDGEVDNTHYIGFLAQDVEKAANEVGFEFPGIDIPQNENEAYTLRYVDFIMPMVKAMQEQQELIQEQQKMIDILQAEVNEIKTQGKNYEITANKK